MRWLRQKGLNRDGGFTLLELLVTVVVIGILVAVLMPAAIQVRNRAIQVDCVNNLRQISLGLTMFVDDQGKLPHTMVTKQGRFVYQPLSQSLVPYYLNTDDPFWCKADTNQGGSEERISSEEEFAQGELASSYLYNDLLPDAPPRARKGPVPILWDSWAWHPSGIVNVAFSDGSVESLEGGVFERIYFNWYTVISRPDPGSPNM